MIREPVNTVALAVYNRHGISLIVLLQVLSLSLTPKQLNATHTASRMPPAAPKSFFPKSMATELVCMTTSGRNTAR